MHNTMLAILVLALLSACSSSSEASRVLDESGFKNIQITGYRFFGCDKHDKFHTGFKAVGPSGKNVSGVVCSGFLKSATIRLD